MNCKYFHCATGATANEAGTALVLTFSEPTTATDPDHFCFRLCASIPNESSALPVQVTVNGTEIPLWNKYGNPVIASSLKTRRVYKGYFGNTNPHVIVQNLPFSNCACVL